MPKVLETKLKRKARKTGLGKKTSSLCLRNAPQNRLKAEEEKVVDAWHGCEDPTITIQLLRPIHRSRVGPYCRNSLQPGLLETADTYGSSIAGTGQFPWRGRGKEVLPTISDPAFLEHRELNVVLMEAAGILNRPYLFTL